MNCFLLRMDGRMFLCLAAMMICRLASGGEPNMAYPLEGEPFMAELEPVTSRGELRWVGAGRTWDVGELFQWGALRENLAKPQFILRHGGVLVTELVELDSERVMLGDPPGAFFPTTIWQAATLPRSMIQAIIFRPPVEERQRDRLLDRLKEFRESDTDTDVAWLDNGDLLRGEFLGPWEAENLADAMQPWKWRVGGSELEVQRSRLIAMAWKTSSADSPAPFRASLQLGFGDGSYLRVQEIRRDDTQVGSAPRILLTLGPEAILSVEESDFQRQLSFVRPSQDRVVFLSDLTPLGFRHVPMFSLTWPLGDDRNVLGGRLRYGQWWAEKGLGMHSVSRVAYEVPDGAERFQAELVLDRSSGRLGSVQGRVYSQRGEEGWQLVSESPVIRGEDAPWPFDVRLEGAERLAIIVDQADLGSQADRANWLNARFLLAR